MNARQLIDSYSGPSEDEIAAIIQIIKDAPDWRRANDALQPHLVRFFDDDPTLSQTHAPGGYDPGTRLVFLNAAWFDRFKWSSAELRTTIEHELTHRGQFDRAGAQGADPNELQRSQERHLLDKDGHIRMDRYRRQPHEMQALARNAVSTAKASRQDLPRLMRRGSLAHYAPIEPGDRKRFLKYAYQMSQNEPAKAASRGVAKAAIESLNCPGTRDLQMGVKLMPLKTFIREQAVLIAAWMLNESIVRVCASCEEEVGPQKAEPGDKSHTYCKRHAIQMAMEHGSTEMAQRYQQSPDDSFAPDLSKHPELVDTAGAEEFKRKREEFRRYQNAHLTRQ